MEKKTYSEKLKDPRWQKKRLEILERDGWKCMACGEKDKTLHVHHIFYIYGLEPWDIPNGFLITFCEECHKPTPCDGSIKSCKECPEYNDPDEGQRCWGIVDHPKDIAWEIARILNVVWSNHSFFGGDDYATMLSNLHYMIKPE